MKNPAVSRIFISTPCISLGDVGSTVLSIIDAARNADRGGADIVLTPELSITGASLGDMFLQSSMQSAALRALSLIISSSSDMHCAIVCSLPVPSFGGKIYKCAVAVHRGRIVALCAEGVLSPDEARVFSAPLPDASISLFGSEFKASPFAEFSVNSMKYVLTFDVELLCSKRFHLDAVLVPGSVAAVPLGEFSIAHKLADISKNLDAPVIFCSSPPSESTTDCVFAGYRVVSSGGKTVLSESALFSGGDFSIVDLPVDESLGKPPILPEHDIKNPFLPASSNLLSRFCGDILDIQSAALSRRMGHIGASRAIVAVSGGLDSALALIASRRALDKLSLPSDALIAVTMPGFGTTGRTYKNALALMKSIGATVMEMPISDAVRAHFAMIGHDESDHSAVYENAQARERTQIALSLSNKLGGIFVGSGDMSEMALGWTTFAGDHIALYGVNGGIPKTVIREVVRYCAGLPEYKASSEYLIDILDTPVSPELLPSNGEKSGHETEDLVGPYALHDFFLFHFVRGHMHPKKIFRAACSVFDGVFPPDVIDKWLRVFLRRFSSQQFKRSCMIDGPAVFDFSLSPRNGLSMPSDMSARTLLSSLDESGDDI